VLHFPKEVYTRRVAQGNQTIPLQIASLTKELRHAIQLVRWLFTILGLSSDVRKLCNVKTLKEQQEMWPQIRRVLLSRPLHWCVVSTEWFAWKAAGVPPAQRRMIISDRHEQGDLDLRGEAMWQYIVDTLDPVVKNTLISDDNYFYLLCLQGRYSQRFAHGKPKQFRARKLILSIDVIHNICRNEHIANSPKHKPLMACAYTQTNFRKSLPDYYLGP